MLYHIRTARNRARSVRFQIMIFIDSESYTTGVRVGSCLVNHMESWNSRGQDKGMGASQVVEGRARSS